VVIKPGTSWEAVLPFMELIDVVLVMSVEPGFGGQSFMEGSLDKIKALRGYIDEKQLPVMIQVDGGINDKTAVLAVNAGADMLVVGSYLFKRGDVSAGVQALRASVSGSANE
jgi:ribulose-phosphate 3-epimerase